MSAESGRVVVTCHIQHLCHGLSMPDSKEGCQAQTPWGKLALRQCTSSRNRFSRLSLKESPSALEENPSLHTNGGVYCPARCPQQEDLPAGHLIFLLCNPEALGIPLGVIPGEQGHCCPGVPTYPGEGPEALEDSSVACAAAQVSCGPRKSHEVSAGPSADEGRVASLPAQSYALLAYWFSLPGTLLLLFVLLTLKYLSLLLGSLPRMPDCAPMVPSHSFMSEIIKPHYKLSSPSACELLESRDCVFHPCVPCTLYSV